MTAEEIFAGELDKVEFKKEIPAKSEKYMKSVVAFTNGKGGKMVFGVGNNSWKVAGFSKEEVFQKMDTITNAIFDSCEPKIKPNIGVKEVEGKVIIEVEIIPGMSRPYFIKSQGLLNGTYIRVSGTTHHAERYQVEELILEGQNRYYDCEPYDELEVTSEDIETLCEELKMTALKNTLTKVEKAKVTDVTQDVLLAWGVLSDQDEVIVPTNAYALLTGQAKVQPVIQCAVFKGADRTCFVDHKEFGGPIQEQMAAAFQYILEKINRGIKIKGKYKQDAYELPMDSVRELIANFVAHRSYLDPGNIQIGIFDDRLEVICPGMLLSGVSVKKMMEGYSKIRNRAIANAFSYMKIIEKWGSGIPRVIRECKEYGLPDPVFIDFDGDFRANIYRQIPENDPSHSTDAKGDAIDISSESDTGVLQLIRENPAITQGELKEKLNVSLVTVKRLLSDLQKREVIERQGSSRTGRWAILSTKE